MERELACSDAGGSLRGWFVMVTVVTVVFGQRDVGSGGLVATGLWRWRVEFWFVTVTVVFRTLARVRRRARPADGVAMAMSV